MKYGARPPRLLVVDRAASRQLACTKCGTTVGWASRQLQLVTTQGDTSSAPHRSTQALARAALIRAIVVRGTRGCGDQTAWIAGHSAVELSEFRRLAAALG